MKDLIRRWLGMNRPSESEVESLGVLSLETLAKAKNEHISDLRVLIDKGHAREAELAAMVRMAMEHQFYRPTISGVRTTENRVTNTLPAEHMQDVTVFDEKEDGEMVRQQENELAALIAEQNTEGAHKVEA